MARFQGWDAPHPREAGEHFIGQMMASHPDTAGEWFQFAVVLSSTGELIGDCAARPHPGNSRQAEIGFSIAPEQQSNRYATEAARRPLGYLFGPGLSREYTLPITTQPRRRRKSGTSSNARYGNGVQSLFLSEE